jgi:outer membrane receptor protein involved in Fe transport
MVSHRWDARVAGLIISLGAAASNAQARAAETVFAIPQQPREAALMALGRQGGVSLGFAPDAHCDGRAGISGRMTLDAALERLLAGSACVASRPDARTVVIRARAAVSPRPAALSPPAPRPPFQFGEVVVTAEKTETLLSASPYGLTATTGAELERHGVADVRDLSLLAAGVTVTNLGPGRDKVLLRGLSDGPLTGHTQSTVGLYLGELRLTYNAPDPDLPLIDVARIEVLRGPQGTLYGAGSVGGVLQVTPNPADPALRSGLVYAGLADTANGALSRSAGAVFNQPLVQDVAGVRVAAWSEVAGGYLDNPRLGRTNVDRSSRHGVRFSGLWRATDDLTLEATLVDQAITSRDAHYTTGAAGPLARTTLAAEPHDNDFLALSLTSRWSPAWGRLTASVGALDHDVTTTYDASAAPANLVPPGAHPETFKDSNHIRGLVSEVRVASVGAGRLHWTAGVFYAFGVQKLDGVLAPLEPVAGYAEVRKDRLRESAAFGEVSYDVTPALSLTAGGRVFESRLKTRSAVSLATPVRTFAGRTGDSGFAPKLLAAYRPVPGLTVYVQAAEGYRTSGFNTAGPAGQAFGASSGDLQPLRNYADDELWNYEAGVRWRWPDLGVMVRAAAFQANWEDIQADLVLPSGLPFTANLGDGRSRGVELEGSYVRGALSLSANVVRQNPELRRPAPGLPTRRDTGLPGVPDLSYAATALYSLPLEGRRLDLSASYAYVGHSHLTFDALTAPRMGAYGELRLAATLSSGAYSLRLSVENALDRRGDTLAFGNPFTYRTEAQQTPQRPRTVGLRASRRF